MKPAATHPLCVFSIHVIGPSHEPLVFSIAGCIVDSATAIENLCHMHDCLHYQLTSSLFGGVEDASLSIST